MQNIVTVEGLTKKYGEITAVDNLSFTVREGEIFGFLGPNGAGKSTTLNVLSTLTRQDRGSVTVGGHSLETEARSIKAMIGLVPQDIALYSTLTARENVAFFASLYGLRGGALKEAVATALRFTGLEQHARTRAGRMSGGMQRRLNIACGIAHRPKLIVMDEPTVGVDAQSRGHIMNSIRALRDKGATVIYTSHYMPEVQEICDRIAIIDHGRLAGIGTEQELLQVVTDTKTLRIVANIPGNAEKLRGQLAAIPGVQRARLEQAEETGDEFLLRLDVALSFHDIAPVLRAMMEADCRIHSVDSEAPSLETTFLALTGRELR